jgi:predicted TIM-barrel fold metal-dependent hydrolase
MTNSRLDDRATNSIGDLNVSKVFHDDMREALSTLRAPTQSLPPGSCDCHAHVFGPFSRFPLVPVPAYTPPLAPFEDYVAMLDRVGTTNGVLVHAGACGYDNSAMLDALKRSQGRLRGVAVPAPNVSDAELERMHELGVRGIRFSGIINASGKPADGFLGLAELISFAPRLRTFGWHAQIWMKCEAIAENAAMLRDLNVPVVFDHMGQFEAKKGASDPSFRTLVDLLSEGQFWLKTTAFRNSQYLPEMEDVRPFHETLLAHAPKRLVWGSDWPFIGMGERMPNVGHLLDILRNWTADDARFRDILVTNPRALYGF